MAKWKKSPEELVALMAERMKEVKCDHRKMFGYPAYFVDGRMFAGVFEDQVFLRLPDAEAEKLAEEYSESRSFEPMKGRPMRSYVTIPKAIYSSDEAFKPWIEKSIAYTQSLPKRRP